MGDEHAQRWDPNRYASSARFVSDLGAPVVDWLAPVAGERVLDLGCGDGALTVKLLEAGCRVLGVDASAEMVAAARQRGIDAREVDAHALPFQGGFDAVFSNAALHWMTRPSDVIAGVWSALEPGGRFVGEFGGCGNVTAVVTALTTALRQRRLPVASPWFFPDVPAYRRLLEDRGFLVERIDLIDRRTPIPGDAGDWIRMFGQPYLQPVAASARPAFVADVVDALRGPLLDAQGQWWIDYVRLRFLARRPPGLP